MLRLIIKGLVSAALLVLGSELSAKDTKLGGLIISLPLTSLLAICWKYGEGVDSTQISTFTLGIFWMVIPSLAFFLVLPLMLKYKFHFIPSLLVSCLVTAACYKASMSALNHFGILR